LPAADVGVRIAGDEVGEGLARGIVDGFREHDAEHQLHVRLVGLNPEAWGEFGDNGGLANGMSDPHVRAGAFHLEAEVLAAIAATRLLEGALGRLEFDPTVSLAESPTWHRRFKGLTELRRTRLGTNCDQREAQCPQRDRPRKWESTQHAKLTNGNSDKRIV
jgi:hypothetical protein